MKLAIITLIVAITATAAGAQTSEYCAGFEEGYKAVRGDMVMVPMCPIPPITPIGSTDYREGLKDGMAQGQLDD